MKKQLQQTLQINKKIVSLGLQFQSFGNVSLKFKNYCLIKPSGVNLNKINYLDISVVDMNTKKLISGKKPSVDLPTHLIIYKNFPEINSIVHTHSIFATSWAQGKKPIPCLGTTHADYFKDSIPITKEIKKNQLKNYETQTGNLIVNKIKNLKINPLNIPGILVSSHGPFSWGANASEAIKNAQIIEYIAQLAFNSKIINNKIRNIPKFLHKKHFKRKIGPNSYYGQK